ncbi:MAG: hypothetical protein JKY20_09810 [Alphaproteobacteria bacterium]|nr:hypothetical protein [Alphaproteobacteria bacterium]
MFMKATLLRGILIVGLLCGFASATAAADLRINAFYGAFKGSGIAENADSLYFGATVRDLDVEIGADTSGRGFFVRWTTVIRSGGDPNNPNVRRKTQSVTFKNTDQTGVYRGEGSGDPLNGAPYIWARISGQTLTVYILTINKSGGYNMQSYARTLNAFGMDLVFSRIRDGEPVRQASAKLTKR